MGKEDATVADEKERRVYLPAVRRDRSGKRELDELVSAKKRGNVLQATKVGRARKTADDSSNNHRSLSFSSFDDEYKYNPENVTEVVMTEKTIQFGMSPRDIALDVIDGLDSSSSSGETDGESVGIADYSTPTEAQKERATTPGAFAVKGINKMNDSNTSSINIDQDFLSAIEDKQFDFEGEGDSDCDNIAVAVAIEEEEDGYLQSAIEFDPNAKQTNEVAKASPYKFLRLLLSACLAFIMVVVAVVVVAMTRSDKGNGREDTLDNVHGRYRETLGIRERVEFVVGGDRLSDTDSSFYKALEWITHDDPLQGDPENPAFMQRYVAACVYFATSVRRPWTSCNPPQKEGDEEDDFCEFDEVIREGWTQTHYGHRWLTAGPVCDWNGVICDDLGEVREIRLNGINTTGAFPRGIQYFHFARSIQIGYGDLRGELPQETLVRMKHLAILDISVNAFSGMIPLEWWSASNLQVFRAAENGLSGTIPEDITSLTSLQRLHFNGNSFNGSIPGVIGTLRPTLLDLVIDNNQLTGTIPTEIGGLVRLVSLHLDHNRLHGDVPTEIGRLGELLQLKLHSNKRLGGKIPDEFYHLEGASDVDLSECNFTGTIGSGIGQMEGMERFRIYGNSFSGTLPTEVGLLTDLKSFVLHENDFVGSMPAEVCKLRGEKYGLKALQADCSPPVSLRLSTNDDERNNAKRSTDLAELECDDLCCTVCCNNVEDVCLPTR